MSNYHICSLHLICANLSFIGTSITLWQCLPKVLAECLRLDYVFHSIKPKMHYICNKIGNRPLLSQLQLENIKPSCHSKAQVHMILNKLPVHTTLLIIRQYWHNYSKLQLRKTTTVIEIKTLTSSLNSLNLTTDRIEKLLRNLRLKNSQRFNFRT